MSNSTTLGLEPSFGFGDRLGLATPGHLDALRAEGGPIRGIFPQQSIREMARTRRTPEQVMGDACDALDAEGFDEPFGADADHLKVGSFARVEGELREGFSATCYARAIRVRYHTIYQGPAMGRNKTGQYRDPFLAVTRCV